MPSYTAPVDDMMFLFEKLRNNQKYNELEKYKEVTSDLVKDILQEAAKINQNLILPLAKIGDESPAVLENGVVRTPPGYKEAYKKYIEVEGFRNYPVRTINQEDQSDWQWKDHQQDLQNHRNEEHRKRSEERKQQEKIFIEETTDALKECLIKKLSFVVLPDDLRDASKKLWNSALGKQLNQWFFRISKLICSLGFSLAFSRFDCY